MQLAIALILFALGLWLVTAIFRLLHGAKRRLTALAEEPPQRKVITLDGPVRADGLVYLFAHDFVKPLPQRPLGSVSRDRAFACLTQAELDPEDFARQLLYATLVDLINEECLKWRFVKRDPTFLPPYPHKQWELQFRQLKPFASAPLNDALGVAFDLSLKNRLRGKKNQDALAPEDEYFTLEELLERGLKAIRQEMTFWERGTCCSDLRGYVESALIAQGYLQAPGRDTWLETVRKGRPTVCGEPVEKLAPEAKALGRRLEAFRKRFGSPVAIQPEKDERGQIVDIDPKLATHAGEVDDLPFDDSLRLTIHESIAAIKQLEPSGEAGI